MTQQDKERIEKDASNALRCLYLEVPESIAQDVDNKVSSYVNLLKEQLKQERNKAIDDFKQRLKSRIITWNASTQEDVPSYSYRDIFKLIDNL